MAKRKTKKRNKNTSIFFRLVLFIVLLLLVFIVTNKTNIFVTNSMLNSTIKKLSAPIKNAISGSNNTINEWNLILVNNENPIPNNYKAELVKFELDVGKNNLIDKRINSGLSSLFLGAEKAGIKLKINSSYRSHENQKKVFNSKVTEFVNNGDSAKVAKAKAKDIVALPGTSEHETGLAVDLGFTGSSSWDNTYSWLADNAYKYGFILRYPEDKTDITGVKYEPWHFRYVGKEAAEKITRDDITLEEYVQSRDNKKNDISANIIVEILIILVIATILYLVIMKIVRTISKRHRRRRR